MQSIDLERLGREEQTRQDKWIFQGEGNNIQ